MEQKIHLHRSHLFTVRLWLENLGEGKTEWRGQVQHVLSGERRYFRDWPGLAAHLLKLVENDETARSQEG